MSGPLYRIQLGAFRVAENAETARRQALSTAGSLIGPLGLDVETTKGGTHILRTHKALGRSAAADLCARLQARTLTCFVARAARGKWSDGA